MPIAELRTGQQNVGDGVQITQRGGRTGETVATDAHGPLYEASRLGNLFMCRAVVTAPVIFTTAAGTGGPFIWNGSTNRNVSILRVGWGITVVSTVAAAIGLTGGTGQTAAPTGTTAIDSTTNGLLGGSSGGATAYRVATPTAAGAWFFPVGDVQTGALTTSPGVQHWVNIDGAITVPPNGWCSFSSSATASTLVIQASIIYEELPV